MSIKDTMVLLLAYGAPLLVIVYVTIIALLTSRNRKSLQASERHYEVLFHLIPEVVVVLHPDGTVKHVNQRARQYVQALNIDIESLASLLDSELQNCIAEQQKLQAYETEINVQEQQRSLLLNAEYITIDDTACVILIITDITEHKLQQQKLQFLAYQDSITKLPNRRYFLDKLEEVLLEAKENNETVALLLVDLDQLQWINDKYGHLIGDETLQFIAELVQKAAGPHGVAARMGGAEFIFCLPSSPTIEEVETLKTYIQYEFARYASRFESASIELHIGASFYPIDGTEGQALIHAADYAMFEIKHQLKNA